MIPLNYVLDDSGVPHVEPDVTAFFKGWCNRVVKSDQIGEIVVSTIFLGIDHNWTQNGPPILWETMVFRGPLNGEQTRCSGTKEQAEAMHDNMVARVKQKLKAHESTVE